MLGVSHATLLSRPVPVIGTVLAHDLQRPLPKGPLQCVACAIALAQLSRLSLACRADCGWHPHGSRLPGTAARHKAGVGGRLPLPSTRAQARHLHDPAPPIPAQLPVHQLTSARGQQNCLAHGFPRRQQPRRVRRPTSGSGVHERPWAGSDQRQCDGSQRARPATSIRPRRYLSLRAAAVHIALRANVDRVEGDCVTKVDPLLRLKQTSLCRLCRCLEDGWVHRPA